MGIFSIAETSKPGQNRPDMEAGAPLIGLTSPNARQGLLEAGVVTEISENDVQHEISDVARK